MAPHKADKVLILIDVRDPMTYDKEFVRSIRYSPYVVHMDEISERSRQQILKIDQGKDVIENPTVNKFSIELDPDRLGDFVVQFLANANHQRALVYLDYNLEPMVDWDSYPSVYADREQDDEQEYDKGDLGLEDGEDELGLLHVYELKSGAALEQGDSAEGLDMEDDEDDEAPVKGGGKHSLSSLLMVDHESEEGSEDDMDDKAEDLAMSGAVFVSEAPKMLQ